LLDLLSLFYGQEIRFFILAPTRPPSQVVESIARLIDLDGKNYHPGGNLSIGKIKKMQLCCNASVLWLSAVLIFLNHKNPVTVTLFI